MNSEFFPPSPPMGWNSYDYYDTTVTEDQIRANADYMASHLKEFGWEYVVVDIEWYSYDTGTQRDRYQYIPFWRVEMDEFSRLLPCPDRFPSSANGQGFGPLADYVHGLGLKFGIHIMRGIPRIAAHTHTGIYGTDRTANEIADPNSICTWNPDMYGVIPGREGAQEYYDSIMDLYARWGVDFIKCDDICRMDAASAKEEIRMLRKAINQCGRPMVFSLSPGPARLEEAWHYETNAHMWRMTDDFWDDWKLLLPMFERCELWQNHVGPGSYPDCDMLPVGMLGKGFGDEHPTHLTREEQITMMTLWCMFRSPLMIGGELTLLDGWTKKLLTNREVLSLLPNSKNARQVVRDPVHCIWRSEHAKEATQYLAVFNLSDEERKFAISPRHLDRDSLAGVSAAELWTGETFVWGEGELSLSLPAHGAKLYRMAVS
ncbi:glycoside hydrolase family 27 protein [Lachnospiraceae bacterium 54-53]